MPPGADRPPRSPLAAANLIADSSSPIQDQLTAVHNGNDNGLYPNPAKAMKEDRKYTLLVNSCVPSPEYDFKKNANRMRAFMGNFFCGVDCRKCLCGVEKRFINVHLHCIVSNLKRISKMSTLPLPEKLSADAHDGM